MSLPSEPITRKEAYLAKAAGQDVEIPAKPITREEEYLDAIAKGSGGGGGTSDYSQLTNKPQINGNTLTGNKTASQLGLASTADLAAKADNETVGTVESSATASKAYAVGNYLVLNGVLYRVTTAIESGGSIVTSGVGQNVTATTITAEMEAVEIDYDDWMELTQQERETGNWFVMNYPSVPAPTVDYSTSEVNTGVKWIDGKTIYRKVVEFGNLPKRTTKNVSSGLTNESITNMHAIANAATVSINIPYTTANNTDAQMYYDYVNHNIVIITADDYSDYTACVVLEYTKTA